MCRSEFSLSISRSRSPIQRMRSKLQLEAEEQTVGLQSGPQALGENPNALRSQNPRRNCDCPRRRMQKHVLKKNGSLRVLQSMQEQSVRGFLCSGRYGQGTNSLEILDRVGRLTTGVKDAWSGPSPLYGTSSGWWVILPWRLGTVHESIVTWAAKRNFQAKGTRTRPMHSCSVGRRTACDPQALGGAQCGEQRGPDHKHRETVKLKDAWQGKRQSKVSTRLVPRL